MRLQVAVDDRLLLVVGVVHREGDVDHDLEELLGVRIELRLLVALLAPVDHREQRAALDVFHREVVAVRHAPHFVDAHDVGVAEAHRHARLALELLDLAAAARRVRVAVVLVADELHRDVLQQQRVPGLVDDAGAAAAQLAQQHVFAEDAVRILRRRGRLGGHRLRVRERRRPHAATALRRRRGGHLRLVDVRDSAGVRADTCAFRASRPRWRSTGAHRRSYPLPGIGVS